VLLLGVTWSNTQYLSQVNDRVATQLDRQAAHQQIAQGSEIQPVFDKYNRLVSRMQDLETAHVKREDALRRDLEGKAHAIIQQQAMLGRVDRLASMNDMAARMAHRLRNPLTGVLITLINLSETNQRRTPGLMTDEATQLTAIGQAPVTMPLILLGVHPGDEIEGLLPSGLTRPGKLLSGHCLVPCAFACIRRPVGSVLGVRRCLGNLGLLISYCSIEHYTRATGSVICAAASGPSRTEHRTLLHRQHFPC
jgi:hypothetical protein